MVVRNMKLNIIILAAGLGKRMYSSLPKSLQLLAGKPLFHYVLRTVQSICPHKIYTVYGYQGKELQRAFEKEPIEWVEQKEQKGTGHAVLQILPFLNEEGRSLILYGDIPLVSQDTLQILLQQTDDDEIGWLTAVLDQPEGFGRIVRDQNGKPSAIIEEKDATLEEKRIKEINTGICVFPNQFLRQWLPYLGNHNAQGEYYLTDLFSYTVNNHQPIKTYSLKDSLEILGVNDHSQLASLERLLQRRMAQKYMRQGLTLLDPERFDIRGELSFGQDVTVDVNVVIEGTVSLGKNCHIGHNVSLNNVTVGDDVTIKPNSVIEDSVIKSNAVIGPFAHIRPGSVIEEHAKVGNFVEIKKSTVGKKSKANHLSYIGDTIIGKNVNIGAGTVTCNYNGVRKYTTIIKDNAFIGSCSQLIAPVTIGEGSTIGAGSTITMDTPNNKLTIARARQITIEHWKRPKE